jgi:hypothetical protein
MNGDLAAVVLYIPALEVILMFTFRTELMPSTLFYSMQRTERGLVIIFNHESYDKIDGKTAERRRHGTSEDVERLKSTFHGLGFNVVVKQDLTYQQITAYISEGTSVITYISHIAEKL